LVVGAGAAAPPDGAADPLAEADSLADALADVDAPLLLEDLADGESSLHPARAAPTERTQAIKVAVRRGETRRFMTDSIGEER
jgi:hypothetical protein